MQRVLRTIVTAALVAMPAASSASAGDEYPPADLVKEIERQIEVPEDSRLADYDRYYAFRILKDRKVIEGAFMHHDFKRRWPGQAVPGVAGAYVTVQKDLPRVADGGCGVLMVIYDIETKKLAHMAYEGEVVDKPRTYLCNGHA